MIHQRLIDLNACTDAKRWSEQFGTLQAAWDACARGDWMLWYLGQTCGPADSDSHRTMTRCKIACARLTIGIWEKAYPQDDRPQRAIEAAELYANGASYSESGCASAAAAAYAAADAYADAYADARSKMLGRCADEIRKIVPVIPQ